MRPLRRTFRERPFPTFVFDAKWGELNAFRSNHKTESIWMQRGFVVLLSIFSYFSWYNFNFPFLSLLQLSPFRVTFKCVLQCNMKHLADTTCRESLLFAYFDWLTIFLSLLNEVSRVRSTASIKGLIFLKQSSMHLLSSKTWQVSIDSVRHYDTHIFFKFLDKAFYCYSTASNLSWHS